MKFCLVKLTSIAAGAVLATQAFAQASANPGVPRSSAKVEADAMTVAANARASTSAPVTRTVTAAGSVLVLVDGVVARAAIAQVHAPAAGFVYER